MHVLSIIAEQRYNRCKRKFSLVLAAMLVTVQCCRAQQDILAYVNPFIGTSKTNLFTRWGGEGGLYPGAVAPSGYLQLTPETSAAGTRGYDYADSVIYHFSCLQHSSGFPNGSAGRLFMMPLGAGFIPGKAYHRPFLHANETASPGYYSVVLSDDGTRVEATASAHTGVFRFSFPGGVLPRILITDAGKISFAKPNTIQGAAFNAVIQCGLPWKEKKMLEDGVLLDFESAVAGPTIIEIMVSASTVDPAGAQANIDAEQGRSFEEIKTTTRAEWKKYLSVVEIQDENLRNKQIFYTALYHSLLVPWIISGVDGRYRGADGKLYAAKGKHEYGHFSPWDTYRTLHPLLSLLYPDKQGDMLRSIMDIYHQSGYLPTESMTGNHAVAIIADAYAKGITTIGARDAYRAMRKSLVTGPFLQADMAVYNRGGYIPFTYPESVTRTVEYAYDDWVMAQFAAQWKDKTGKDRSGFQRGNNYRNLFNKDAMLLLPRNHGQYLPEPGNKGYKEGDKWVYTYAVPHNAKDMINLMGGEKAFAERLNSALTNRQIVFDNETVFHIPYLFTIAGNPRLTQRWVSRIMDTCFSATPGGLPGNDDLGAVSSWYVFSALGIYPLCPGNPFYSIGTPLFQSAVLHLANRKILSVQRNGAAGDYAVQSLVFNKKAWKQLAVTHAVLVGGGELVFGMGGKNSRSWFDARQEQNFSVTKKPSAIKLSNIRVAKHILFPDEQVWIKFSLHNNGPEGTRIVKLYLDGKAYASRNCLVPAHATREDSLSCRLYAEGGVNLALDGNPLTGFMVNRPAYPYPAQPLVSDLLVQPVLKTGDAVHFSFTMKNTGGLARTFYVPVLLNGELARTDTALLLPGESKMAEGFVATARQGLQRLAVNGLSQLFKAYDADTASLILDVDICGLRRERDSIADKSGFGHTGSIVAAGQTIARPDSLLLGKDCFVEFSNSYSLDHADTTLTMMAWVYPTAIGRGLVDLFSKGDNHVLQLTDGKQLTFFAGGWGRGDCTVALPADWQNNWHHIAGVCTGRTLQVYIDGRLQGFSALTETVNLSVNNKWVIGRNEEFPFQRIFSGYVGKAKIFTAALDQASILEAMHQ